MHHVTLTQYKHMAQVPCSPGLIAPCEACAERVKAFSGLQTATAAGKGQPTSEMLQPAHIHKTYQRQSIIHQDSYKHCFKNKRLFYKMLQMVPFGRMIWNSSCNASKPSSHTLKAFVNEQDTQSECEENDHDVLKTPRHSVDVRILWRCLL